MVYSNDIDRDVSFARPRTRDSSVSRSSIASRSSTLSICAKTYQASPLAELIEGHTDAYGSFTATMPASLWLRTHLKLNIPALSKSQGKQSTANCGYDTPPDSPLFSPLLFSQSKCPSISRTLTTDSSCNWYPAGTSSPILTARMADTGASKLHPVLEAVEKGSRLSYRTVCSTCMKVGRDFPRCGRCGDMWCSRECRLQGSKKHICASRRT